MAEVIVSEKPKTLDELMAEIAKATQTKDWKAVTALSRQIAKLEEEREKSEKEKAEKALESMILEAKAKFDKLAEVLIASKKFDIADGFWYAYDFGDKSTSLRVKKTQARVRKEGGATAGGSYVAGLPPTKELLDKVGSHVMFKEDTTVTIDHKDTVMKAGTTFKQAHETSDNGGWRNRVRMALAKEAGLAGK